MNPHQSFAETNRWPHFYTENNNLDVGEHGTLI